MRRACSARDGAGSQPCSPRGTRARADVPIHRHELRPESGEGQLALEVRADRCTQALAGARRERLQRSAQSLRIAARPETPHRARSGQCAKGGDVGDDRRQAAGERFDQRIAAALAVAAGYEEVGGPHQPLDTVVGHSAEQLHPLAQLRIACDALLNGAPEWGDAETAIQPQRGQRLRGRADAVEDRQRILVGVEVSDPLSPATLVPE